MTSSRVARLHERIAKSPHVITIHYPVVKVPATGSPVTGPTSPLTGAMTPPAAPGPVDTVPVRPPVRGIKCLWYEAAQLADLRRNVQAALPQGWITDADQACVVRLLDVLAFPTLPFGKTIFDDADYVEHELGGKRFKVIKAVRLGASFELPHSLLVYLQGNRVQ